MKQVTEAEIKAALDGTFRRIVHTPEGQKFETVEVAHDHVPVVVRPAYDPERRALIVKRPKQPAFGRRFGA